MAPIGLVVLRAALLPLHQGGDRGVQKTKIGRIY